MTPEEQKIAADLEAAKKQAEADAAKAKAANVGAKVETKSYKLKAGFTHYVKDDETGGIRQAHAGDSVDLTEAQFNAFSDRFEDPSKPEAPKPAAPEPVPAGNPDPKDDKPKTVVPPPASPTAVPPSTVARA